MAEPGIIWLILFCFQHPGHTTVLVEVWHADAQLPGVASPSGRTYTSCDQNSL